MKLHRKQENINALLLQAVRTHTLPAMVMRTEGPCWGFCCSVRSMVSTKHMLAGLNPELTRARGASIHHCCRPPLPRALRDTHQSAEGGREPWASCLEGSGEVFSYLWHTCQSHPAAGPEILGLMMFGEHSHCALQIPCSSTAAVLLPGTHLYPKLSTSALSTHGPQHHRSVTQHPRERLVS